MPVHQRTGLGLRRGNKAPGEGRGEPVLDLSGTLTEVWRMKQADKEDRRVPFLDWSLKVPEPKTGTLDFSRFPFQRELYEAAADKEAAIKKASQIGVSTFGLRWIMYWTDQRGWTGLYIFPKTKHMYDFSDARVKPVIERSDYLQTRVPPGYTQNKGLKQIGLGFMYLRGSESEDDLLSVDADHVLIDEYDSVKPGSITEIEKRMGASTHGLIRRVGVPSYPDYGIAKVYKDSDQRVWLVKCWRCGHWQVIKFWPNDDLVGHVDQRKGIRVCGKCVKSLEPVLLGDEGAQEWVATFPERSVRGYHISRLMLASADLEKIVKLSKKRKPLDVQSFYNHELGEEYAAEEGRLSDAALAAAQSRGGGYTTEPGYVGDDLVTMGVDVASVRELHVRVSRHEGEADKKALFLGTVESFNDLPPLMRRYGVHMCAIDHLPEGRSARAFAAEFPGQVYLVVQSDSRTAEVLTVKEEERLIVVRRVEMLDATLEMVRAQQNRLPLDWPDDYAAHMKALQRVVEKNDAGQVIVKYISTGPDDFAFAEAYDVVATELWFYRQAVDDAGRQRFTRLEDKIEFERSQLSDYDHDDAYHGGFEGEVNLGPEFDDDPEY